MRNRRVFTVGHASTQKNMCCGLFLIRTLAGCWKAEGRIDDWIQLYNEASERLENPKVSQYSRCDFLQFGSDILRKNDRLDAALLEIEKLERANGKPGWRTYFRFWLAIRENRLAGV